MKKDDELTSILKELPDKPGVYKFFDLDKKLLYVGKAKNIKKRVSSYFLKNSPTNGKTLKLVSKIRNVEYILVNSEFDAFLLEHNLIKEFQPKYNIQLKDDKTFPYICITNESFPKIISTRNYDQASGKYFGPYSNVKAMNTVIELIRKMFFIRTCHLSLTEKNITEGKFKVCLEYHIGNCKGPCEHFSLFEEYYENIEHAEHILKGSVQLAKKHFKEKMLASSAELNYEKAQQYKIKLELLDKFQNHTEIINPSLSDLDVITIVSDSSKAIVGHMKVVNGMIVQTNFSNTKKQLAESDEEILESYIAKLLSSNDTTSLHILTNVLLENPIQNLKISTPKTGDKKKLIDLSLKNCTHQLNKLNELKTKKTDIVLTLQKDLNLTVPPRHIECFDNSNIQGAHPVASMVCFINGKPSKKNYRHFNIKTVIGPDDFSSMKEIVYRRYHRLKEEQKKLPDLIVIDGGKGQLNAACEALKELGVYGKVAIVSVAKRLEEIFYPEDQYPLYIDKKSTSIQLIQHIRNEAHRFAITFHRQKRSIHMLEQTVLNNIAGLGEKTIVKLLKEYKTIEGIESSSDKELSSLIGQAKVKILREGIKKEKEK